MKINKIDHISIAVKDLDQARRIWEPVLGKTGPDDAYIDESEKINVARYWIGEVGVELMESLTPDGEVAKFIEKKGEGVMVVSLNVDNTRDAMAELGKKTIRSSAEPGRFVTASSPLSIQKMNGVLLELIDDKGTSDPVD